MSESTTLSVFGDLNAKHSSWQSDGSCNTAGNEFFELLLDFGLTQCVHSPTRFSSDGHSCSVIDTYATNRPELITDIEISDPVSDHCMVTASIKMHRALPKSTKKLTKFIHDFRNVDWHKVRLDLMKARILQAIQGTENIDCALVVWENMIMAVLQHRVPTREIRMRSQRKMWMTSELYHLSKRKSRLFKIPRSTRSEDDWSKYARFRNFSTSGFRSARANFLRQKHEEISSATNGSHRW